MTGRMIWIVLGMTAVLLIATTPGWLDAYYLGIVTTTLFFIGLASAWNIVGGMAGQFSLGNSLFVAMGSTVVSALITLHGWSLWPAVATGAAGSAVLAVGIGALMFRRQLPHLSFALVTLAFAEVGLLVITSMDALGAASGVVWSEPVLGIVDESAYLQAALALAVASVVISWLIHRSRLGHRMRAIRDDESAAAAIGTNLMLTKTLALVISAMLTSVVATFYANYVVFVDPNAFASPVTSISVILFVVLGGLGTVKGPVLGAGVLYPLAEILRGQYGDLPGLSNVVFGVAILLVVLFAPTGLSGLFGRLGESISSTLHRGDRPANRQVATTVERSPSGRSGHKAMERSEPTPPAHHLTEIEKS